MEKHYNRESLQWQNYTMEKHYNGENTTMARTLQWRNITMEKHYNEGTL